jgi:hypothetical protein
MRFKRLKRREFITLLGGATAACRSRAQKFRRIGIIDNARCLPGPTR